LPQDLTPALPDRPKSALPSILADPLGSSRGRLHL
jgi:hypothetical protein